LIHFYKSFRARKKIKYRFCEIIVNNNAQTARFGQGRSISQFPGGSPVWVQEAWSHGQTPQKNGG